jgi:hypothetical protein
MPIEIGPRAVFLDYRLLVGVELWKPEGLFGSSGEGLTTSLASQRLVGEVHLDDFSVSHTKDSIKWEGNQEELLTDELSKTFEDFKRTAARFRKNSNKANVEIGPNTGSGRYSSGTDTKPVDNVRIWYQVDLVTA